MFFRWCWGVVLLSLWGALQAREAPRRFIIASGSRGGNYYRTGEFVESQYNRHVGRGRFLNIRTNGSVENIGLLRDNRVDFAIVQRGVLLHNLYGTEKNIRNLAVIMPLFQERLNIYYRGPRDVPIETLPRIGRDGPLMVGVTDLKGYSYRFFRYVLKYLDVDDTRFVFKQDNYDRLIDSLVAGRLDLLVSFSLPLDVMERHPQIHRVFLSRDDADVLSMRLRNVMPVTLDERHRQFSIGTWSFLVGAQSSIAYFDDERILTEALLKPPAEERFRDVAKLIRRNFRALQHNESGAAPVLANLPLSEGLQDRLGAGAFRWKLFVIPVVALLLVVLFLYFYRDKWFSGYKLRFFWYRYKHFQLGFVLLALMYFLSIELLLVSEKMFYQEVGIKSPILNLTFRDLLSWVSITAITGNSNGIFPLSLMGKVMLAVNSLNFWIGTLIVGISEYLAYRTNEKRKAGLMHVSHKKHLVIFGWNDYSADFVRGILHDARHYYDKDMRVVCVVPDVAAIRERYPEIRDLHDSKVIDIIRGDALDTETLKKASVETADTVLLLAEQHKENADERTVMRAVAISHYVHDKYRTADDRIYMIAELHNPDYLDILRRSDVNEVLISGNYHKGALKQAIFNHGISQVLNEIVNINEDNEFYKIDLSLPENKHLVGKTFDELLVCLRKVGILLVAVQLIFTDEETGEAIIDRKEIRRRLAAEEDGITRDILVNPVTPKERNRRVDDDDHLIVLARNMKEVTRGIRRLKTLCGEGRGE